MTMTDTLEPDTAPPAPGPTTKPAAKKAAPKDTKPPAAKKGPGRPTNSEALAKKLAETIVGPLALPMMFLGPPEHGTVAADLMIVVNNVEPLAAALVKVAETNPTLMRVLKGMTETGAWSELGGVAFIIVLGILANHDRLPAGLAAVLETLGNAPTT